MRLVDASLLRALPDGRFDLHALLHQFGQEKLAEDRTAEVATRDRHLSYFLSFMDGAWLNTYGGEQQVWLDQIESVHENLNAALAWSLESERIEQGLVLANQLERFWTVRSHHKEGRAWLEKLLSHPDAQDGTESRGLALRSAGWLAFVQYDYPAATSHFEEGLALFRALEDEVNVAHTLYNLGMVAIQKEQWEPGSGAPRGRA